MKRSFLTLLFCILFLKVSLFAQSDTNHNIGFIKQEIYSNQTNETISTALLYPTNEPSKEQNFGPFKMNLTIGAKIVDKKSPLVLISHGSSGSNLAHRSIAFELVKNGFIVAMPLHPKNNYKNNSLVGTNTNLKNRVIHINEIINNLHTGKLAKYFQKEKVFLIGHSLGAYTALVSSGAIANTSHAIELCKKVVDDPYCKAVFSNTLKEEIIKVKNTNKIKALVLMAPVGIFFKDENSLEKINIPTMLLQAQKDEELSEPFHSELIYKNFKNKELIKYETIQNAGHYSFITPFPKQIQKEVGVAALDPQGFNREEFHKELSIKVLNYLNKYL